jgi:hypothetical protein
MLSFVEALKQIIANIQTTGGAVIERTFSSSQLLQKLREHAIHILSENAAKSYVLDEWFTEGFFDEYVRVCVIYLYKLGIVHDDHIYRLLTKVIESVVLCAGHGGVSAVVWTRGLQDFDERLARSLNCIWENMGDEQTYLYTTAQSRWLIAWDYQKSQWKATGLGQVFMELSPIQAAIFLLSTDVLFATGKFDFHHVSSDMLRRLQSLQDDMEESFSLLPPLHRDLLTRLGILFLEADEIDSRVHIRVTPIGQLVLHTVLSQDNPFRDTALAIIRTEEVGGTFNALASEINEVFQLVNQTDLIDKANRESIYTSIQLYHSRKYLNSLRVVYPSIEAIMNTMLIKAGEAPERFNGLVAKAQCLGQRGIIPYDVSHAMEVFTGKNKVVHGNYSPPEDYVFPLCQLAFRYLRRLLTEYFPEL